MLRAAGVADSIVESEPLVAKQRLAVKDFVQVIGSHATVHTGQQKDQESARRMAPPIFRLKRRLRAS